MSKKVFNTSSNSNSTAPSGTCLTALMVKKPVSGHLEPSRVATGVRCLLSHPCAPLKRIRSHLLSASLHKSIWSPAVLKQLQCLWLWQALYSSHHRFWVSATATVSHRLISNMCYSYPFSIKVLLLFTMPAPGIPKDGVLPSFSQQENTDLCFTQQ